MGQTQVKLLGTYLVPRADVNIAATFQSTPGPTICVELHRLERVDPAVARPSALGLPRQA